MTKVPAKSSFTGISFPLPTFTLKPGQDGKQCLPQNRDQLTGLFACNCPFHKVCSPSIYAAVYDCANRTGIQEDHFRVFQIVAVSVGLQIQTKTVIDINKFPVEAVLSETLKAAESLLAQAAMQEREIVGQLSSIEFTRN